MIDNLLHSISNPFTVSNVATAVCCNHNVTYPSVCSKEIHPKEERACGSPRVGTRL